MIDLDGFKSINDDFGHDAGDRYLKTIAEEIRKLGLDGFVYRLGGDEFALRLTSEIDADKKINSLLNKFRHI